MTPLDDSAADLALEPLDGRAAPGEAARAEVLIVDDEPSTIALLLDCLSSAGHSGTGVTIATEAAELLRTRSFDVMLCDLKMPRMSGVEIIAKARVEAPDTAIIVITAVPEVETAIRAMRMGAYDYVVKPFSPGDVVLRVAAALEMRRSVMQDRLRQEGLRAACTKLQQMTEMKDNLVQMVVHDLKSPLSSAMGYLELIERKAEGTFSERQLRYLQQAYGSCKDVLRMTTTMLDLTRFEHGALQLHCTVIDLAAILREAKAETEGLVATTGGRVEVSCHPTAAHPLADPEMVRRMLSNLLANAVKHTPLGTNVRVTAEPDGAGHVVVSVSDSGKGIAPEHQARIFEKFCQLDADSAAGGAGIGLAFCKMAAEAHGGRIWVESRPGQGSTFRFSLPQAGPRWATELNTQTGVRP